MPEAASSWEGTEVVLLDRDGVLNRKLPEGQYVDSWARFAMLSGVPEAIKRLNAAAIKAIVVTNQRGIALGLYGEAELAAIHDQLGRVLQANGAHLDGIYFCPHDKDSCDCRKPGIGLLRQAFADFPGATKANTVLIGDSLSDIEAGRAFGIRTIFIEGEPEQRKAGTEQARALADAVVGSLSEAVDLLCPLARQND